jgi:hypothetical protein
MGVYDPSENYLQAVCSLFFRLSPFARALSQSDDPGTKPSDLFKSCYIPITTKTDVKVQLTPRELIGRCEMYMSNRYALLSYQPVGQLKLYETVDQSTCNVTMLGVDYDDPQTKFQFRRGCGYEDDSRWSIIAIVIGFAQKYGISTWVMRPTSAFANFDYGFTLYNDLMYAFEYAHILSELFLRSLFK